MSIQEARPIGLAIAPPIKQSGVPRPRPGLSQGTPTEKDKGFSSSLQAATLRTGEASTEPSTGSKRIKVEVDDQSRRPVAVIVDSVTNEVIREIPPEQMVDLSARLHANLGAVFNRTA